MRRRALLAGTAGTLAALAGCLRSRQSDDGGAATAGSPGGGPATDTPPGSETRTDNTPDGTPPDSETPTADAAGDAPQVAAVRVADFVVYPLSGTHPHVHRRVDTQYVVVRVEPTRSADAVRRGLALELDGEAVALANRQPVPWEHDTVDVAFAVPKGDTHESGRVLFDGTEVRSLPAGTLQRLNNPPVFEVGEPTVSPGEIGDGERTDATVQFTVHNTGEGPGTFGASLKGNFLSGSETVTATLEAGTEREVTGSTRVVGEGETASVRLDWGSGTWSTGIPVTGTTTDTTESPGA